MSRIACACSRESSNFAISPSRAASGSLRGADQFDHRVEVVERDQQPLEDVGAGLGPAQFVLGAAGDDLALVLDVVVDQLAAGSESAARRRPAPPC